MKEPNIIDKLERGLRAALLFWLVMMLICFLWATGCLGACTPAPTDTPTPCISWDAVTAPDLAGYKVYSCDPDGYHCQLLATLPGEPYDTDNPPDGTPEGTFYRGVSACWPVQRGSSAEGEKLQLFVKAYATTGMSSRQLSTQLPVCMPAIWRRQTQ